MKLTKKLEAEILKAYNEIWDAYLRGNMRTFASILDENCYIIGSAAGEVFSNKKAAVKYYKSTAKQITGKAEFRNRKIKVMPVEKGFMVNEESDFYLLIDDQWTFYGPGRISSLFHKKNNKWKVIHQHGSFPDSKTEEGEQVNTDKIKAENIQLRDAVKRRTEELENKNRELEIEAALERVRAVAMAMRKPEDLSSIDETLFTELKSLGFTELRNTEIIIISDAKETLTSYYYSDYGVTGVVEVDYKSNSKVQSWVNQFKKANDAFAEVVITEKEIKAWRKYREEVGHLPDPKLNKAKAVYYYSYSIGMGGLSISTFKPASNEQIKILERFRNVFNLSYQRYIDIAEAEAQAKESMIELALERVRAKTMAMQKSEELHGVNATIIEQIKSFEPNLFAASIHICIPGKPVSEAWIGDPTEGQMPKIICEHTQDPLLISMYKGWQGGKQIVVERLEGIALKKHFGHMMTLLPETIFENVVPPELLIYHFAYFSKGFFVVVTREENVELPAILKRFAKVFEQTYTRFLDLQKAEAQAREARIEAALEKVRGRAMAMHNSNELLEAGALLYNELFKLGIPSLTSGYVLMDEKEKIGWNYVINPADGAILPKPAGIPHTETEIMRSITNSWKKQEPFYVRELDPQATIEHHRYLAENSIDFPISVEEFLSVTPERLVFYTFNFKQGYLLIAGGDLLTADQIGMAVRFAKVFEMTYRRFLDLQKAEAQAREAQIQLALERVRARSLAMHHTSELQEVVNIVAQQLHNMNIDINGGVFIAINDEVDKDIPLWASGGAADYVQKVTVPFLNGPVLITLRDAIRRKNNFFTEEHSYEEKIGLFEHLFKYPPWNSLSQQRKQELLSREGGYTRSVAVSNHTSIAITNHKGKKFSDDDNEILERFGNVFEQSYTRFLDLQKSEAQAKESQIQLALERVRARTMAMQKSDELMETAVVLFDQLRQLGENIERTIIGVMNEEENVVDIWATRPDGSQMEKMQKFPIDEPILMQKVYAAWRQQKKSIVIDLQGEELESYFQFLKSRGPKLKRESFGERRVENFAFFSKGMLGVISADPNTAANIELYERFASVFDQTYTRFLDLQRSEAQARESQIEVSLERVRSRAMAMQTSEELNELIGTVFTELTKLDLVLTRCVILIYEGNEKGVRWWMANSEAPSTPMNFFVKYADLPFFNSYLKGWQDRSLKWQYILEGEDKIRTDNILFNETELSLLPDFVIAGMKANDRVYLSASFNNYGCLNLASLEPLSDEHFDILLRFAKVFDLTYTRFNDLKQAEAQKREAQIELALERVRARTMAMYKSEELAETAQVLFQQLSELGGIPDRIAIGIADEGKGVVNFWTTDQQGSHINDSFTARLSERTTIAKTYQAWKEQKKSLVLDLQGEELKEWIQFAREEMGIAVKDDQIKDRRVHTVAFFSHGWILVTTHEPQSPDTIQILERFGSVFNLTYRRFLDLKKAEAQANEARIEIALERIRARALAMHKSDELMEVANVLREQMALLGQPELESSVVHLYEEDPDHILSWRSFRATDAHSKIAYGHMAIPKNCCEVVREWVAKFYSELKEYTIEISGAKQEEWYDILFKLAPDVVNAMRQENSIHEKRYYRFSKFSGGALLMVSKQEPSSEVAYLQSRAAVVFDLAYRRFSDLQKAEAQAREAHIEAALEKVRSRSLAMHKSDELQEVVNTVFERLQELNIEMDSANIAIFKEGAKDFEYWIASPFQKRSASFHMPYIDLSLTKDIVAAKESGLDFSTTSYPFEIKNEWFDFAFKNTDFKFLEEERKQFILDSPGITIAIAFSKHTGVQINRYSDKSLTEGEVEILKRFSKVFEQAYIRFLDLEKAEAQAREAQIEAGLERVRSKTMAMHKSEEVTGIAVALNEELMKLGFEGGSSIIIIDKETGDTEQWTGFSEDKTLKSCNVPYFKHPCHDALLDAWKKGKNFLVYILTGEEKKIFDEHYFATGYKDFPESDKRWMRQLESATFSHALMKYGAIHWGPDHLTEEQLKILQRFSKVFEQSYTRFLDLQKAEAQARDAQIETSLERVRSKTMAMHNSQDVGDTVGTMFDELVKLGIQTLRCGIGILHEGYQMELWTAKPNETGKIELFVGHLDMKIHPLLKGGYESWKDKKDSYSYELKGEDLIAYFNAINNYSDYHANYDIASLPSHIFHNLFNFNEGCLFSFSLDQLSAESSQIFKRFAGVFGQTYRRYLDLQKAEANAREAQIEVALERVRSKAMAMHKSEDLNAAVAIVFEELEKLDLGVLRCGLSILDKEKRTGDIWVTSITGQGSAVQVSGDESFDIHPLLQGAFDAWLRKEDFSYLLKGDDLIRYYEAVQGANFQLPESQVITSGTEIKQQYCYATPYGAGGLFAFRETEFPEEAKTVMKRFAGVFDLTYKRFLDLQKAEANVREAQIEAGLERVRARTMAMHSSEDVSIATATMFTELEKLGIENFRGGITNIHPNRTQDVWSVNNLADGKVAKAVGAFNIDSHPFWQHMFKEWEAKKDFTYYFLAGQEKEEYVRILNANQGYLQQAIQQFPDVHFQVYYFKEGAVWTNSLHPHSEEDKQVMNRFTSVFSLTFRRYQDLKKAEAQAREAQIEAGLERVRSRTMAMHSSEDVTSATETMFDELKKLGIDNLRCGIANIHHNRTFDVFGVTNLAGGNKMSGFGFFGMDEHPVWKKWFESWKNKEEVFIAYLAGQEKEEYFNNINNHNNYLPQQIVNIPDNFFQAYYFEQGSVWAYSLLEHSESEKDIMKRFATSFSLTFRRYQDLQKAEAQAREATIEASLEKVRGKAMAMHNSNDLTTTASLVFTELRKLGISPMRCGVGMLNKESRKALLYTAIASEEGDSLSKIGWVLLDVNPVLRSIYDHWNSGEDYFPTLTKEMLKAYYEHLKTGYEVPEGQTQYEHYGYFLSFSEGVFYGWSENPFTDAEIKILKRFTSVIDLTFRRYMELQKSEATAREAVKQAALDRIRADIASMRTINDLDRITPLIWNELTVLGIPFIRCGVFIMDEKPQLIHTFLSTPDGKAIAAFHLPYDTPGNLKHVLTNWQENKNYIDHWDESEFIQFADILVKQGALASAEQYLKTLPKGGFYLHFLPFLQGMLYVGNTTQLNHDEIELIQHIADAFSTAYARYEDFNKLEAAKLQVENTLTDLKQAQQQLVQSEKMASLGELTAGIAHEIQNPLNFVNNFSDVSNELLEEMKGELATGNMQSAMEIAEDVKQNLEKILHHGKRADAIVKGMLQHSRTSSGQKEPTDINILADEYLRLAFHGLRAKDKSFNAKFETEFDNNIGKINIIPQDIGRVILNLINNAFYAVTEKRKQNQNGYDPVVTVTTKKDNGKIEIKVKDNGNGIPQKVLDKIFQPFFTTKPTGQGTGLGLSLAYDIITKGHGGELKVETKEGEGSEFIIQIPTN